MSENGAENRDVPLLIALASGVTIADAAAQAGVSTRTASRRLQSADFRAQLAALQAEALSRATARLAALASAAVEALGDLLGAEAETARLGAARAILDFGPKMREHVEFESRLASVEAALAKPAEGAAERCGSCH